MSKPKSTSRKRPKRSKRRPRKANAVSPEVAEWCELAKRRLQAGQVEQAMELLRSAAQKAPNSPEVLFWLGTAMLFRGDFAASQDVLKQAAQRCPPGELLASIYSNLGTACYHLGRLKDAKVYCSKAVEHGPGQVDAMNILGVVSSETGDLAEAESWFTRALSINPGFRIAKMNLANLWQRVGRFLDAENSYRALLQTETDSALLWNNLGEALSSQGKTGEAIQAVEKAIELQPETVLFRINLSRYLGRSGDINKAEVILRSLIDEQPKFVQAHLYLGKLYFEQADFEAAKSAVEHSLILDAENPFSISTLGFIHLEMGDRQQAEVCFRDVIRLEPDNANAHSILLYLLSSQGDLDQAELFEEHVRWGKRHAKVRPLKTSEQWLQFRRQHPDRPLRIGYVSPDFRQHAVASFIEPVLKNHDHRKFEVYAYANVPFGDATTLRLKQHVDCWRNSAGVSDQQLAGQVLADEIDILVDLAGHTGRNQLAAFAYRPAPVQVTWLGYPNTTGLEVIDFRFTCETQNPFGEPSYHTEKLYRLPHGSFCFSPPDVSLEVSPLPAKRNGYVTFGALHRPEKISGKTLKLWAGVLSQCNNARLRLFNTRYNHASMDRLIGELGQLGIEPGRIQISNQTDGEHYLAEYGEIDIALDATPWAGGTTTLEALWMGVPVIAYFGDRRSARSTAAIVKQVGFEDWIARTPDEYQAVAVKLTKDQEQLQRTRNELRRRVSETVLDAARFTRDLESAFLEMWRR